MGKTGEFIQRVLSPNSKGVESNSSRFTRRHVYSALKSVRNTLMFNKINKNQFLSHWNYSTLPCVELIPVTGNDCPCLPPSGCEMMRTKYQLPKPIASINKHMLISVTDKDGDISFSETTFANKKYKSGNKYTGLSPDYFIKDEYLFITVRTRMKALTIIGLFNDPIEVANFPNLCSDNCEGCQTCPPSPMEVEFNIDAELETALISLAMRELILMFDNDDRRSYLNNNREAFRQDSQDQQLQ